MANDAQSFAKTQGSGPGSQISCSSPQLNHTSFLVLLSWLVALVVYRYHKGLRLQCWRSNPILGNMHSRFQKAGTKFGLYLDSPHRVGIGFSLYPREWILFVDSLMAFYLASLRIREHGRGYATVVSPAGQYLALAFPVQCRNSKRMANHGTTLEFVQVVWPKNVDYNFRILLASSSLPSDIRGVTQVISMTDAALRYGCTD